MSKDPSPKADGLRAFREAKFGKAAPVKAPTPKAKPKSARTKP